MPLDVVYLQWNFSEYNEERKNVIREYCLGERWVGMKEREKDRQRERKKHRERDWCSKGGERWVKMKDREREKTERDREKERERVIE